MSGEPRHHAALVIGHESEMGNRNSRGNLNSCLLRRNGNARPEKVTSGWRNALMKTAYGRGTSQPTMTRDEVWQLIDCRRF